MLVNFFEFLHFHNLHTLHDEFSVDEEKKDDGEHIAHAREMGAKRHPHVNWNDLNDL